MAESEIVVHHLVCFDACNQKLFRIPPCLRLRLCRPCCSESWSVRLPVSIPSQLQRGRPPHWHRGHILGLIETKHKHSRSWHISCSPTTMHLEALLNGIVSLVLEGASVIWIIWGALKISSWLQMPENGIYIVFTLFCFSSSRAFQPPVHCGTQSSLPT